MNARCRTLPESRKPPGERFVQGNVHRAVFLERELRGAQYQELIVQTGTILHQTDGTFDFGVTSECALLAIKKSATGTNSTEIHVIDYPGRQRLA